MILKGNLCISNLLYFIGLKGEYGMFQPEIKADN